MSGEVAAQRWAVRELLLTSAQYLKDKGATSARLDAELLLAHVLRCDRVRLYVDFDRPLGPAELSAYRELVKRRAGNEPVAYILGTREFYGLNLKVTPEVLIPRPETEILVDAVLERIEKEAAVEIFDVGTGSGAVALALAVERPGARICAGDVSAEALALARENAAALALDGRISFIEGSLFDALPDGRRFDAIVSNPPYIGSGEMATLPPDVRAFEPKLALEAGADGLAVIRQLIEGAPERLVPGGLLAFEMGADQGPAVRELVSATGCYEAPQVRTDLAGRERVLSARLIGS